MNYPVMFDEFPGYEEIIGQLFTIAICNAVGRNLTPERIVNAVVYEICCGTVRAASDPPVLREKLYAAMKTWEAMECAHFFINFYRAWGSKGQPMKRA